MIFPLDDWQFWIVTIVGLGAAWLVVKPFIPRRRKSGGGGGGCTSCSAGMGSSAKPKKTKLTIGGRRA